MEKLKLKKLQMKEQVLLPPNLHDIRDGLVLDYNFEENGSTVSDQSGNGNNGTIVGATRVSGYGDLSGVRGDGVDDTINAGNDSSLDITEEITLMSLIKPINLTNAENGILSKNYYNLILNQDRYVRFELNLDGAWHNFWTGKYIPNNEYSLIAGDYDGEKMIIYIDGKEVSRSYITGNILTNTEDVKMGLHSAGFYKGDIAISRIYNKSLSKELHNNQALYFKKIAGTI